MQDLANLWVFSILPSLLGAAAGFAGAFFLFFIRDVWLQSKRTKAQRRHARVQRQLEKLYTPLFMLIKYGEFILKDRGPTLTYISEPISLSPDGFPKRGADKGKRDLDSIILNYGYLAGDDELMRLLPQILGAGFYDARNKETVPRMVELIVSGYEKLRKEYFTE
jgi:hypothetical protein